MTTVEEVLAHFGVKGMKWGVKQSKPPTKPSGDWKSFKRVGDKSKVGGLKALTNKELQAFIKRASLESQFKAVDPRKGAQAKRFIADLLRGTGKQQASRIANDIASTQVTKILKRD